MVTKKTKKAPTGVDPDPAKLPPHVVAENSPSHNHAKNDPMVITPREILSLLHFPENEPEERQLLRMSHALQIYRSLDPVDATEAMLVRQMIGVHFASQDCFRRANITNQTFAGRDLALRHGEKLSALYIKQLAAYDKRRGKGQQKVTVEHVHVHSGGQAIVGNVEAGRAAAPSPDVKQLENASGLAMPSLDGTPVRQRATVRSVRKK